MALIVHQPRVSKTFLPLSLPLPKGETKLGSHVSFHVFGGTTKFALLKYDQQWSSQPIIINKGKVFKISSFKGNLKNDEAEGTDRGPKSSKKSVQLSSSQQEKEEITAESPKKAQHSVTFESEEIEASVAGSSAIKKQFEKWLTLLRAQPQGQAMHGPHSEKLGGMGESEILEACPEMHTTKTNNLMKASILHFWKLDATIKLPLLIFPPSYMAVRVFYGAAVAKELMPLWVLGPLVVALYVKMIKRLCFLYALCFKLSSNFVTRLPHYHKFYINEGRAAAYLQVHLWQPIIDMKNADHKELSIEKLMQLREWVIEKQLDYMESIWPYFCRTVRFLKQANLI